MWVLDHKHLEEVSVISTLWIGSSNNRLNRSRNLSASSSNSSFHGSDSKNLSALPVVAGKLLFEVSCFFFRSNGILERFFLTEFLCYLQNFDQRSRKPTNNYHFCPIAHIICTLKSDFEGATWDSLGHEPEIWNWNRLTQIQCNVCGRV